MSLPQAIASGAAAETPDAVKPLRVGIGAGVLAALFLFVVYLVVPVPARMIELLGGPTDAFGRQGGLVMEWVPPPGVEMAATEARFAAAGDDSARLQRRGEVFVLEVPGVAREDIDEVAKRIGRGAGGLAFHEVLETEEMKNLASLMELEIDQWRPEDGGDVHMDFYISGATRAELDEKLARARGMGWSPPAGTHIAYQDASDYWRTYVLSDRVELDGSAIANAVLSYDPNTNRPLVLLDFTPAAAGAFGELTERITGRKLAIVVDGLVSSAPIINGRIAGGRASIMMGGSDPVVQEREAAMLTSVLRAALPAGGTVRAVRHVPPGDTVVKLWISRVIVGLGGGALAGLLAWTAIRATRPVRRRAPARAAGALPWTRIAVTLLAPLAVFGLTKIPLLGIDYAMLDDERSTSFVKLLNLGTLGLTPIVTAFILVELIALAIPSWRRRRHAGAAARAPLTNAVVALTAALVILQSLMVLSYFEKTGLLAVSTGTRAAVIASLLAGTLALAIVAHVIRRHGLGSGYGALVASGWLLGGVRLWLDEGGAATLVLGGATVVAMVIPLAFALRWRVGAVGEVPLRVPTSSIVPFTDYSGLAALLVLVQSLPLEQVTLKLYDFTEHTLDSQTIVLVIAVALVALWSFTFARPAVVARLATRTDLQPPSSNTFWRATGLSVSVLLFATAPAMLTYALRPQGMYTLTDPLFVGITTVVLLDILDDLRARRGALVTVWTLQHAQHADVVSRALTAAEIPHHMTSSHTRTLLAWFGPFVPIDVLVPANHARDAHEKLAKLSVTE